MCDNCAKNDEDLYEKLRQHLATKGVEPGNMIDVLVTLGTLWVDDGVWIIQEFNSGTSINIEGITPLTDSLSAVFIHRDHIALLASNMMRVLLSAAIEEELDE